MSNDLWLLFEMTLNLEFKKNPELALITVDNFIAKNVLTLKFDDRLKALDRLKKLIERIK